MEQNLYKMFVATVKHCGDKSGLMWKEAGSYKKVPYTEFKKHVDDFALGLYALGLRRGEFLALLSENRKEWTMTDLACHRLGVVDVPIYSTLTPKEIEYLLNDSGSKFAVVSTQEQLNKILAVRKSVPKLQRIIVMDRYTAPGEQSIMAVQDVLKLSAENAALAPQLDSENDKIRLDDVASIIYTSGTTG